MGCIECKQGSLILTKEDLDFLIANTRFDEATIKEWFKGSVGSNPKILKFEHYSELAINAISRKKN